VEKGGWPQQRMISGSLENIAAKARDAKIEPPAILVVGDVVKLAERLAPRKIAIFRPNAQLQESAELALKYGFQPVCAPSISLEKRPLPVDLVHLMERAKCVVFTSANGVEIALQNETIRSGLKDKIVFSIGPKTRRALEKHGITSEVPKEYSSRGLEDLLENRCKNILFLRSAQGSQYLSEDLRKAGLKVDDVALYDVTGSSDPRLDRLIDDASTIDVFAFTSSSTARCLLKRAKELGLEIPLRDAMARAKVAVIGKPTAMELEWLGIRVDVMPEQFTFEALLQAIKRAA
jgi:uroporphyrinogen-III synthase